MSICIARIEEGFRKGDRCFKVVDGDDSSGASVHDGFRDSFGGSDMQSSDWWDVCGEEWLDDLSKNTSSAPLEWRADPEGESLRW